MAAKFECVENLLADQAGGEDLLRELLRSAAQAVMAEEVARHLGASSYERSEGRRGFRNGTKPRSLKTRVGELTLRVPQVREMEPYHPSLFARYQRSERALLVACAEMYYLGSRPAGRGVERMGASARRRRCPRWLGVDEAGGVPHPSAERVDALRAVDACYEGPGELAVISGRRGARHQRGGPPGGADLADGRQ